MSTAAIWSVPPETWLSPSNVWVTACQCLGDQGLHGPVVGECVQVCQSQAREESGDQWPEVTRAQHGETGLEKQGGVISGDVTHDLESSVVMWWQL